MKRKRQKLLKPIFVLQIQNHFFKKNHGLYSFQRGVNGLIFNKEKVIKQQKVLSPN